VTGNTTLYAKWTFAGSYTVTFNSQGGSSVASQSISCGDHVSQPLSPTRSCYTFGGWFKQAACTNPWNFSSDAVTGSTTLYAKWTVSPLQVTLDNGTTVEHCISDPITCTNSPGCVASYEWHFQAFMGDQTITPGMGEFSGCTTNTLTINTEAGMTIWCILTDRDGRQVTTGKWNCGGAYCP
jgi:uncharacterized repeat protein (TIGR02543 family)